MLLKKTIPLVLERITMFRLDHIGLPCSQVGEQALRAGMFGHLCEYILYTTVVKPGIEFIPIGMGAIP